LFRGFTLERHFSGVIALGHHAEQFVPAHDEHGTDVLVGHKLNGFEDAGFRRGAPECFALVGKDFANSAADHAVFAGAVPASTRRGINSLDTATSSSFRAAAVSPE